MIKRTTQQCEGVKVTLTYDDETDKVISLKLDIEEMLVSNIQVAMAVLEGTINRGTKGEGDE